MHTHKENINTWIHMYVFMCLSVLCVFAFFLVCVPQRIWMCVHLNACVYVFVGVCVRVFIRHIRSLAYITITISVKLLL